MSDPKLPSLGDIWIRTFAKTKAAMDSGVPGFSEVKLAPGDKVTPGAMLIRKKPEAGRALVADMRDFGHPASALDDAIRLHKMHMEDPNSITPATQYEMMAALLKARDEKSGAKA